MLCAGLLALPMMLAFATPVQAQGCTTGSCGFGGGFNPGWGWGNGGGSPFGCGVFCMKLFGTFHQDGPLFNYGPYAGYYPFEPYGPWNSQLQYTGPTSTGHRACGWNRPGTLGRLGGLFHRSGGCSSCGDGHLGFFRSVLGRIHPFAHSGFGCHSRGSIGCGSCGGGGILRER
jgi:hypothetical protein